jgi:hypothetical protein
MEFNQYDLKHFLSRQMNDIDKTDLMEFIKITPSLGVNGAWLAGGAIRRTLLGEKEINSDYDMFFANEKQKNDYVDLLVRDGGEIKIKNDFNTTLLWRDRKVQAIHIDYYNSPQEVINSFDYTICQFITDGKTLFTGEFSLWDLARKRLSVHKITYPVASQRRLIKYTQQGFYACAGCLQDILLTVKENPEILEFQVRYID